jgi:hypothetical protein
MPTMRESKRSDAFVSPLVPRLSTVVLAFVVEPEHRAVPSFTHAMPDVSLPGCHHRC